MSNDAALQSFKSTIPELRTVPTRQHLFMFSAITWNRHHVHCDRDAALRDGFPDVVVHRALIGDYLGRLISAWLGPSGQLRCLSWRVVGSAFPDEELTCSGRVVRDDQASRSIECELIVTAPQERIVAQGSAQIDLASGVSIVSDS